MCTAATYQTESFYFGRTLDYDFSYGDEIVIMPRNYGFPFRHISQDKNSYALIGMAHVADGCPLYYDAMNEKGLCMAGLNFVGNAFYAEPAEGAENVAQFEFIPYLLGRCATLAEAKERLAVLRLVNTPFSDKLPTGQLHWLIADKTGCITVESTASGLNVYENPAGVLTNNPPFPEQLFNLNNYMKLSPRDPENTFAAGIPLKTYGRGMGALGLPGDLSSQSRFVRAAFVKNNSLSGSGESESVSQFFHILGSVDQQRGCCEVSPDKYEITIYTCCMSAEKGIYYYNTYENHQISAVDMHKTDLDAAELSRYAPVTSERFFAQN
jgi:penicillin V acylase-like amidase (Ntn superfamily)